MTVNTTGGTPTLTLNDGGTATYTGGSGTTALTFSYTVAPARTPRPGGDRVNLNGGTIKDGAGNAASLSLTGLTQTGPQIDTTAPTVSSVTATAGDYDAGKVLTLTLNMSEAVDGHRHADADAQRWRHRQLCQRLRLQCAGVQLHGGGRAEHRCACR